MTLPNAITMGIFDPACRGKKNQPATIAQGVGCLFFVGKRAMDDFASHTLTVNSLYGVPSVRAPALARLSKNGFGIASCDCNQ
jgi:hypothetical protein